MKVRRPGPAFSPLCYPAMNVSTTACGDSVRRQHRWHWATLDAATWSVVMVLVVLLRCLGNMDDGRCDAPAARSNGTFPRSCRLTPTDRPAGQSQTSRWWFAAMIDISWRHAGLTAAVEYNEFPGNCHSHRLSCYVLSDRLSKPWSRAQKHSRSRSGFDLKVIKRQLRSRY